MSISLGSISRKANGQKYFDKDYTNPFGTSTSFPKWDASWNSFVAGTATPSIGFIGDSTTQGICSSGFLADDRPNEFSWASYFAKSLQNVFGMPLSRFMLPPTAINSNDCWTIGAGWTKSALGAGRASCAECPIGVATATTWKCVTDEAFDTVDIYFGAYSGGGTFNATLTGGSTVQGNSAGTATMAISSITVTASSLSKYNELTITPTNASQHLWIFGVKYRNSKLKSISIGNLGVGGSYSQNWNSSVANLPCTKITDSIGSKLTFISLGINENTSDPIGSGYISRMQLLVDTITAYSDVVLLSPFLVGPLNTAINSNLALMAGALTDITGVSKYINVFEKQLSKNMPWFSGSTIHTTAIGNRIISDIIFEEMTK